VGEELAALPGRPDTTRGSGSGDHYPGRPSDIRVERLLPDESGDPWGKFRADIDESIRDVYNPVSFVDMRSGVFACHERVTAGGLEED
jgi:hypothetical protein